MRESGTNGETTSWRESWPETKRANERAAKINGPVMARAYYEASSDFALIGIAACNRADIGASRIGPRATRSRWKYAFTRRWYAECRIRRKVDAVIRFNYVRVQRYSTSEGSRRSMFRILQDVTNLGNGNQFPRNRPSRSTSADRRCRWMTFASGTVPRTAFVSSLLRRILSAHCHFMVWTVLRSVARHFHFVRLSPVGPKKLWHLHSRMYPKFWVLL